MVLGKVGLTGASGMLGRHLHSALQASGAQVKAISRSDTNRNDFWDLRKWLNDAELDQLFGDSQAIIHAGAIMPSSVEVPQDEMFDANVRSCLNLGLWALSRNIPILYISGAIVYKNPYLLLQKESDPLGCSGLGGFYGFTKLLAEDIFSRLRQQGLKLCIIRPTSIYGYGLSQEKLVQRFLLTSLRNRVIELSQPISSCVDLVHASDVSQAAVCCLMNECWETFNVSSGHPTSIIELAESCVKLIGSGFIRIMGESSVNQSPTVMYSLDISHVRNRVGWKPLVSLHSGLALTLNCQRKRSLFFEEFN